jgi:hypothetical protein
LALNKVYDGKLQFSVAKNGPTDRQEQKTALNRQANGTNRQVINIQTDRQIDKTQTNRQIERHTYRQTYPHTDTGSRKHTDTDQIDK